MKKDWLYYPDNARKVALFFIGVFLAGIAIVSFWLSQVAYDVIVNHMRVGVLFFPLIIALILSVYGYGVSRDMLNLIKQHKEKYEVS